MTSYKLLFTLVLLFIAGVTTASPYQWSYPAPVLTPPASVDNGKTVLFDVSHGGTEGNADWVINGAFSDFADALVADGFTVAEYRGVDKNNDGLIQYVDDYNTRSTAASNANEAEISYTAINHADVLVLAESNRPFNQKELLALEHFLADGKGIFFIADHYNADRNLNTWDSTEVFNGYNRSSLSKYNIGGAYGDLRNPGNASAGWLAQTFGLRFRFNAIDLHAGVSGIRNNAESEGLTQGVTPILMAGGATLAITDPTRAKGLIYFSTTDNPTRWNHAVDNGLYFGGDAEGPYVAIAKSGAGKAAFIGDSSPIEDNTPRYRREDNGNTKKTYPGWKDAGNAARLTRNIIQWLATPESYTRFDSNAHPSGTATPNPLAATEMNDPDNGQPWNTPSTGYSPWEPSSFANGAYGAPYGLSGNTSSTASSASSNAGGSSNTTVISVAEAVSQPVGVTLTLQGRATQAINGQYALEIVDINTADTLYVKLESAHRTQFSPLNNPSVLGKILQVTGTRDTYMGVPSVESVTTIIVAETHLALSVTQALASPIATPVTAEGIITQAVNGEYALEMADSQNSAATIIVKLESEYRAQFSPQNNPAIIGDRLQVTGLRDSYMSQASIESVTAMSLTSSATPCATAVSVDTAYASSQGTHLIVVGEIIGGINDPYALELADINSSTRIYVKLEAEQRANFSPANNPSVIGEHIEVTGMRDVYMSHASIESVTAIMNINNCL